MSTIKFGTSGWRAILAEEFTFDNVAVATQAIADHLKSRRETKKGVLMAYDPRFLGDAFARLACEVLAGNGIPSYLCNRDTPTPVVAFEELRLKLDGAINFTASHNPPEYQGLKFNPSWGGPATKDVTHSIEEKADRVFRRGGARAVKRLKFDLARERKMVRIIDPKPLYMKRLRQLVDYGAIRKAGLKAVVDPFFGAGRGYTEEALRQAGASVVVQNANRDPLFGGAAPEPDEKHVGALVRAMKTTRAHIGLATDGDADRFGIVDSDGTFLVPNLVIALLVHHLMRTRKWNGPVVRSIASSHFIDAVAGKYGVEVVETPVGFKWIGELMTKRDILIGGEESGGLTVHRHVPEKDGVLACLLMAEMRAVERRPFRQVLKDLYREVGDFVLGRENFRLSQNVMDKLKATLERRTPSSFAGLKVARHVTTDGHKFILQDKSWLMVRFSGTEPLVRLYCEAGSAGALKKVMAAGKEMILKGK